MKTNCVSKESEDETLIDAKIKSLKKIEKIKLYIKCLEKNVELLLQNEMSLLILEVHEMFNGKPYGEVTRSKVKKFLYENTEVFTLFTQRFIDINEFRMSVRNENSYLLTECDDVILRYTTPYEIIDGRNKIVITDEKKEAIRNKEKFEIMQSDEIEKIIDEWLEEKVELKKTTRRIK